MSNRQDVEGGTLSEVRCADGSIWVRVKREEVTIKTSASSYATRLDRAEVADLIDVLSHALTELAERSP